MSRVCRFFCRLFAEFSHFRSKFCAEIGFFFAENYGVRNLTHMSTQTFDGKEAFTFTNYLSLSVAKKLATVVYACVRKQKKIDLVMDDRVNT